MGGPALFLAGAVRDTPEAPHGMHRSPLLGSGGERLRAGSPYLVGLLLLVGLPGSHWLGVFCFLAVSMFSSLSLSLWATLSMA